VVKKRKWGILLLRRNLVGWVLLDESPDGDVKNTGTNLLCKERADKMYHASEKSEIVVEFELKIPRF